jgi:hypothetical protein
MQMHNLNYLARWMLIRSAVAEELGAGFKRRLATFGKRRAGLQQFNQRQTRLHPRNLAR